MKGFHRQKKAGTRRFIKQIIRLVMARSSEVAASQVVPIVVKNLPANAGGGRDKGSTPGRYLDPLKKEMGTHSSILAWNTPWSERPGMLQSIGWQKSWA